ncbi:HAMP domain-containing sensor histidine kinase [Leptolyngbya sp. FACHB-261]|uniref:sensor histidine kinase n=1 Tax=Leptolyngbya sp. FACHB-261 TaxID=2692806 RepID=UPI00168276BB|nr:HAMP domain-containing sensor histidine kinase [Leptolyngbya sp. FACHB-261]MBD2104462.1 hypothetical protein [Leptolyngbya sp. FACHB-261]
MSSQFIAWFRLRFRHPDWLPTFRLVVLGLTGGFAVWGLWQGWGVLTWLALLLWTAWVLLPLSLALLVSGLVVLGLSWGLGWWQGLGGEVLLSRQGQELLLAGLAVVGASSLLRRFLQVVEWRLAAQAVLTTLAELGSEAAPDTALHQALTMLRDFARADGAIALRQLDEVTAEALVCLPATVLPCQLTTPALFAEALARNQCLYYRDYASMPNASRLLLAQGTQSLAVLPLASDGLRGAILLLWHRRTGVSSTLRGFIESLLSELRSLLRLYDTGLQLGQTQTRFSAILETMPQGVVFVDESGEPGWLNQAAAMLLNLSPGAVEPPVLAGAMATLRRQADNDQELAAQAEQFFAQPQGEIRNWDWIFSQPQARVLRIAITPTQLRGVPGRLWMLDDITEQYFGRQALLEHTQKLSQANQELEKLNQLKDDFLSTVSHELRAPMTNMKVAIQMLKLAPTPERQERYLEILQAECKREVELINDLLDLQRLEIGNHAALVLELINLQEWLPELLGGFQSRLQEGQQVLRLDLPAELPQLLANRAGLERVLTELLNNACKYTPVAGEIQLSVQVASVLAEDSEEPVSMMLFKVRNAAEIPIAELPFIFDKFYRAAANDTRGKGGTGLGLALVQKLLEELQGRIWVESGSGWTTFTVELPTWWKPE